MLFTTATEAVINWRNCLFEIWVDEFNIQNFWDTMYFVKYLPIYCKMTESRSEKIIIRTISNEPALKRWITQLFINLQSIFELI